MSEGRRFAAIVLAAGASTRLGSPKQLVVHEGEPLVRRAVRTASEAGLAPVIIVVGSGAEAIEALLRDEPDVDVIRNADWASGMASSLRAGITRVRALDVDGFVVMLADQPLVDAAAIRRLVTAWPGTHGLVASRYGDALGAPALFATRYADDLSSLAGDAGAGGWLRRRAAEVTAVPLGEAALDIDVPADIERLRARTTT